MNNEHNPIAHLITKIQLKWNKEISPFPEYKIIRWLIRADESKLYEGFVHLESTPYGKLPEIFVALLTEFKTLETFSKDLINTWLDTYDKDQKTFDSIRSNGTNFKWDDDYFRKKMKTPEANFDQLLLEIFSTFHEALQLPGKKLTIVLMPFAVNNIESYKLWLKRMIRLTIPVNVQLCIFDYIDERFFDSLFNEFDPSINKTLLLQLDLKGATNKILQAGDPNSPPIQLRNYMLKMSEALSQKDLSKLDRIGNECIEVMTRTKNKLLMSTAYIMYAGMLFNFKKHDEIERILQKGLKVAQAGKSAGDAGCYSLVSQYCGYLASNYQLCKNYKLAVEWYCRQAQYLIDNSLMAPAMVTYKQASNIAKDHVSDQYKQLLHKGFLAGENLKKEELAGVDYNSMCLDYCHLLQQSSETDMHQRVENKMNTIFGQNWKEETKQQL